jgi:type II restriction/modification system DNA methylase subunit YeeA
MSLSLTEFVNRWKINALSERGGSQSHFIDLCDMLGQPHPAAADSIGERYAFDKPLTKVYGGKGFADVWLRDHFAWEYKGKHKDLKAAYKQINDYREDLGNPRYREEDKSPEHPDGKPYEPTWPEADFIIGNPPFLGGNRMRIELPNRYVDDLHALYKGRVPPNADLVVYWFEKARSCLASNTTLRVGLIATQAIRGGVNRKVLDAIKSSGDIFLAWSDKPWLLEGASVHVSLIGFQKSATEERVLDGQIVAEINSDLTHSIDTTKAFRLKENAEICFRADEKGGPFDISEEDARRMLDAPMNVNGRPNADVLLPWINFQDLSGRSRKMWIIDFFGMNEKEASYYEMPFETLKKQIAKEQTAKASGDEKRVAIPREKWWLHRRPGSEMRAAIKGLRRFIVTGATGKHRHFMWLTSPTLPDHQLYVFAREDDYFFGLLHSAAHEIWARRQGTQLREVESGFRYTPESTVETFPFPWPPGSEPSEADSPLVRAIADAARNLVAERDSYLNPKDNAGQLLPESELKDRTLTKIYNQRPEWLANAHRALDEAVFDAYGWPADLTTQEILARLLALNHERAAQQDV